MRFRLSALGLHLFASCLLLSLVLGPLYFAWYRWPGWYLANVIQVTLVLAGVDLVLGPCFTFIIASAATPRRVLAREIAVIAVLQLCALAYGTASLWHGRPLYYAFSESVLQLVQAYDIDPSELMLARRENAPLLPHWYSLPRWIWAPPPQDAGEHDRIVQSAINGGDDVIAMPRYYRPWEAGLPALRAQLRKVDEISYFSGADKKLLEERMRAAGLATDQSNAIPLTGRGRPLLAVFDPAHLEIKAFIRAR
jgi:hypothetical protein